MKVTWGATRTVVLTKHLAIKIPRLYGTERRFSWLLFRWGLKANRQERRWSKRGVALLCPVLFSDPFGVFVIMPRCEPAKPLDTALGCAARALCPVEYSFWARLAPVDNYAFNYGYLGSRVVCFDYGS